ncbi:amidohydrolase family protein [Dactylosporangium sp. NPDC048998]|uniref:amidohydrolase family protein n=1 Tax=Dactylosporangium sp. NPDC048998 TaxID=3363976 RepID=UPI00371B8B9B
MSRVADLMVRHGHVITMDDDRTQFEDGAVAVIGDTIVAVGADRDVAAQFTATAEIDAAGGPVHPGLIEAHLHASYQLFRGALPDQMPEDETFDSFESVFYNQVRDEDEYLSVALAGVEMIRNGTTCFLEAGTILSPDSGAAAAEHVGIRALLGDAFIWDQPHGFAMGTTEDQAHERPVLARTPQSLDEALASLGTQLSRNDKEGLVRGHVAVLGLGTASEQLLVEAKRVASSAGVILNMHQSYSPADTAADRSRFGADPLVRLHQLGLLDGDVTLAHVNHLTDAEVEVVLESGVNIAWAPAASMMWGHGSTLYGRHAELWRRGGNIALGSDSPNWSNSFDVFRQIMLAVLGARDAHQSRTYLTAEDGLYMATRGAARAVGMAERIGSLEVGKKADIVIHTLDRPELVPTTDMTRNLIYSSGSKSIDTVVIGGTVVLEHGAFRRLAERELYREVRAASQALLRRMERAVTPNTPTRRPQR